jgi:hypothetical protein
MGGGAPTAVLTTLVLPYLAVSSAFPTEVPKPSGLICARIYAQTLVSIAGFKQQATKQYKQTKILCPKHLIFDIKN